MIKFIINKLILLTLFITLTTSANESLLQLEVEFKKIKHLQGKLIVELFDLSTSVTWQALPPVAHHSIPLVSTKQKHQFNGLSSGRYAIRVFQDLNNNQLLDKSSNGIPLEPVGFSQNPSLFKGEPTIEDCTIQLNKNSVVSITLRHRKPKRKRRG